MASIYNYVIVLTIGGLAFSFIATAESETKQPLKSATHRINAEYRVAKNKCSLLSGSAEDVCLNEAKFTKNKAMTKADLNTSKAGETINDKACDTNAKAIGKELLEEDMESAVTEIKPIESDAVPPWKDIFKDIFKDRIRIIA